MLSNKAKYGLKALLYLADRHGLEAVHIQDIAEQEHIPKKFLDLILLDLKKHGILRSKKGKGGGYQLAVPPASVSLGQLVRILDGPLAPIPCVSKTAYQPCGDCDDEAGCRVHQLMGQVRDAISDILDKTTLADMKNKPPELRILHYDI